VTLSDTYLEMVTVHFARHSSEDSFAHANGHVLEVSHRPLRIHDITFHHRLKLALTSVGTVGARAHFRLVVKNIFFTEVLPVLLRAVCITAALPSQIGLLLDGDKLALTVMVPVLTRVIR
jgi:hypothetical protein